MDAPIAVKPWVQRLRELSLLAFSEPLGVCGTSSEPPGVGHLVAGQLLVACGHNPELLTTEQQFAALFWTAPIPASSRKVQRHRLSAEYMPRRTAEGKSEREMSVVSNASSRARFSRSSGIATGEHHHGPTPGASPNTEHPDRHKLQQGRVDLDDQFT
ncbi:MAG: hypothetical protein EON54_10115 [Alcaligenaceae bacterium]|nr:MAG: hypothetical protein EON54_10115 [Alcaligenaceae bacterium]